ncbi:leucine-rich repeat-containing protein 69 isoform X5 [Rhineura floridana]|uniref:leucine-rich repeat-containing protein 69 isoform X5 n=1 Tax=Rhineura floridana TaxID=261503 RepID=UPI002AC863B4|nr:leucine-rich repeat-containing protein 69 isoform X5 [Rhineura floridana]
MVPCLEETVLPAGRKGNMAELLRALRGGPGTRSLSLKARGLHHLPRGVGSMKGLERLTLRDNRLRRLPQDMQTLSRLKVLNLGNNNFEEFPEQLKYLTSLENLHLFRNKITRISPLVFDGLQNLVLLNLNNNQLSYLPPEIHRLENLECVSLDNNQLQRIPKEFCCLRKLRELHLSHNSITALPEEIKYLTKLKILILSRNQIEELPDELTARFILDQLENKNFSLHRAIKQNLEAQNMLSHKRECAQCGHGFLGMWLECVQFVDVKQKRMKTSRNLELLPVRVLLCSYKCFNHRDHELFGIAIP